MHKDTTLAALVAIGMLVTAGTASAQQALINGGGAPLPADLYKGQADSILPGNFSYAVIGSDTGKKAFLENTIGLLIANGTGNVHFAGIDTVLSRSEIFDYNNSFRATILGPIMQIPSAAMAVSLPYNKAGGDLNLNVTKICGVFSGKINDWSQLDSARSGAIKVIYRGESSGTSELLTRFLAAACVNEDLSATRVVGGKFQVKSIFADVYTRDAQNNLPAFLEAAPSTGGSSLYNRVYQVAGAIGYVGPNVVPDVQDATKVAKVKGFSPDEMSVTATLSTVAPPFGVDIANPVKWVPVFANPTAGYPIVGYTNLLFAQCYRTLVPRQAVRAFANRHYNPGPAGNNDAAVRAHGFIPLNQDWREAIANNLISATPATGLGNASTCAGIGR